MSMNLILCLIGGALVLIGAIRGIRENPNKPKSGVIEFSKAVELPLPKENETKIEHIITIENGERKEHWFVYTYVVRPGWCLTSVQTSVEGAIWQKKWSDNLHFRKVETVLRETLPNPPAIAGGE